MELVNAEEIPILTQGIGSERLTDDYYAALMVNTVGWGLHLGLGLPIPEEFQQFNHDRAIADHFLGLLIHPFDRIRIARKVYVPSEPGPKWSWLAFLIPELWFGGCDALGAFLLSLGTDILFTLLAVSMTLAHDLAWAVPAFVLFLLSRILFGRIGHRVYYARHGHWKR